MMVAAVLAGWVQSSSAAREDRLRAWRLLPFSSDTVGLPSDAPPHKFAPQRSGNVSKGLDSANFRLPGTVAGARCAPCIRFFLRPRTLITLWLELPDSQQFFSIARTVSYGGGTFGLPRVDRAVALVCEAKMPSALSITDNPAHRRRLGSPVASAVATIADTGGTADKFCRTTIAYGRAIRVFRSDADQSHRGFRFRKLLQLHARSGSSLYV